MTWNRSGWLVFLGLFAGCHGSSQGTGGATKVDGGSAVEPDAGSVSSGRDGGVTQMPDGSDVPCGDGVRIKSEGCDDGNVIEGDGCGRGCTREPGFNCPPRGGACVPTCGDGLVVRDEECDGGMTGQAGCDQTCRLMTGWVCPTAGRGCRAARCGDGIIAGDEDCDDGNDLPGDGCGTACKTESGYTCPILGQLCVAAKCGDGVRARPEVCDDGDGAAGGGCTAACDAVEPNYACPPAGGRCIRTSECGDGTLTSDEGCDDHNNVDLDGCTRACALEAGWICPTIGARCVAAMCNDGILAGAEQCETSAVPIAGCTNCQVAPSHACTSTIPTSCHMTECNDGTKEGDEACDDGNPILGDGCNPFCEVEPDCSAGACRSRCGDGLRLTMDAEECDDGNGAGGDGCSANCKIETGYACTNVTTVLPDAFDLAVKFRDFIRAGVDGGEQHPDFENFEGDDATEGLVESTLSGRRPVYTGICEQDSAGASNAAICPYKAQTTDRARFDEWYSETTAVSLSKVTRITMNRVVGSDSYRNATFGQQLLPLDNQGWVAAGKELDGAGQGGSTDLHNFAFTSEIRHWFEFKDGATLTFSGDDDVWVFINGTLALDLGGLHPRQERTIVLDAATGSARCFLEGGLTPCATPSRALGITPGNVYEMALFHAERHTDASNFDLTLAGFVSGRSKCASLCGDGIVTRDEACDSGSVCEGGMSDGQSCARAADCPGANCVSRNDGKYGHCRTDCQGYGAQCGDGTIQAVFGEVCDDGFAKNLGAYGGCTATCQRGPRCDDGKVDGFYGEQCDLGAGNNVGAYGGCSATCLLVKRCGDGIVQSQNGEVCDDQVNLSSYAGCGPGCVFAPFCGDGKIQASREACDLGKRNGPDYGGCSATCALGPHCGDGVLDKGVSEECDDHNLNDFDGCSKRCKREVTVF